LQFDALNTYIYNMKLKDFQIKIKIALADDHRLFRDGVKKVIQSADDCKIVLEASNGEELLQFLRKAPSNGRPDVVLLDIQMPVMDGLVTAEILRTEFPEIKVLVLSMHNSETMVVAMLKLGISGYVTKNAPTEELLTAIYDVNNGNRYFSPSVVTAAMDYLSGTNDSSSQKLSQRETQLMRLIFQEKTSEEISNELFISKRTVDALIANLMTKLKVNSRVGIVLAALKKNIVDLEGDPLF
jgi:DNA-binding NarL/FixJ family response regulator